MAGKSTGAAHKLTRRDLGDPGRPSSSGVPPVFLVKVNDALRMVRFDEIDWIGADGNYSAIHTAEGTYLVRRGIGRLEERLRGGPFLRVSRSALVNLHRVERLVPWFHGGYRVHLANGVELKLTRRYARLMFLRFGRPM